MSVTAAQRNAILGFIPGLRMGPTESSGNHPSRRGVRAPHWRAMHSACRGIQFRDTTRSTRREPFLLDATPLAVDPIRGAPARWEVTGQEQHEQDGRDHRQRLALDHVGHDEE